MLPFSFLMVSHSAPNAKQYNRYAIVGGDFTTTRNQKQEKKLEKLFYFLACGKS